MTNNQSNKNLKWYLKFYLAYMNELEEKKAEEPFTYQEILEELRRISVDTELSEDQETDLKIQAIEILNFARGVDACMQFISEKLEEEKENDN